MKAVVLEMPSTILTTTRLPCSTPGMYLAAYQAGAWDCAPPTAARIHNLATAQDCSRPIETLHLDMLNGNKLNIVKGGVVSVLDDILVTLFTAMVKLAPPTLGSIWNQIGSSSCYPALLEIEGKFVSHFTHCALELI